MARPKPQFTPAPRLLNEYQVATRLGKGEEWFRVNRARLEREGFPQWDALLDGWDGDAIDLWLDRRSGIGGTMPAVNPWDGIGGKRRAAVS